LAALTAIRFFGSRRFRVYTLYYGADVWCLGTVEKMLLSRSDMTSVTISCFTAGALPGASNASVLLPGFRPEWFEALVAAHAHRPSADPPRVSVSSVFRLEDSEAKGAYVLVAACAALRAAGHQLTLTFAGSGSPPHELLKLTSEHPWVTVVRDPTDVDLAELYASSDVFVLATRTVMAGAVSGEGFGIVLVEAQLTGTPVIAPAFGGSASAYLEGITGLQPADESVEALCLTIATLVDDRPTLEQMGRNAHQWASKRFDPARSREEAIELLLGKKVGFRSGPLRVEVIPNR